MYILSLLEEDNKTVYKYFVEIAFKTDVRHVVTM